MAIPESQLDTWSHQGAIAGSRDTYARLKSVLEAASTAYAARNYRVFLQGSYCNDTNIYTESDVDIIIVSTDSFHSDLSNLDEQQKTKWKASHNDATYTYTDFRKDVLQALNDAFGSDVKPGTKAITIEASNNRRKADVITAVEFRRYYRFNGIYDQDYLSGICFFDKSGGKIANYPKQHSANLTNKHQSANQWLKPMVRILKNLRSKLIDEGLISAGSAPSYYLEGLLYNVPDDKFKDSYGDSFCNAINWINQEADKSKLVCANEQYYLLWDDMPTSWSKADGNAFIKAAIKLWNDW